MQNKVLAYCRAEGLILPGDTVVCAVSGGADSVVLLDILCALREPLQITVRAAHFNHNLRGAESGRDEAFVRALCQTREIPLTVGSGDVRARAETTGESIEEAARKLRYAFFESLCQTVATAHNADDNLETILLNLTRGTSLAGLCGIAPKRDAYIRPLLCLTRAQIEAYARERGLAYVEDSTNALDDCARNRLRHHVVPLLKAENPALSEAALRTGALLRADDAYLNAAAQQLLKQAALPHGISSRILREAPETLRTRAIRLLLQSIHAPKLSASHILAAERLVFSEDPSAQCSLPCRWTMRREYDALILEQAAPPATFSPVRLKPDGVTEVGALGLRVHCKRAKKITEIPKNSSTFAFQCDTIDEGGALWIRPRQTGDTLRLPGGTRTVKRLLIDRKIPAQMRGLVPVLADGAGVLAVYPLGVNLDRLAAAGERAIIITIEKEDM